MNQDQQLDQQILDLYHQLNDIRKAATIIIMHCILGKANPAREEMELLYPGVDYNLALEVIKELFSLSDEL